MRYLRFLNNTKITKITGEKAYYALPPAYLFFLIFLI